MTATITRINPTTLPDVSAIGYSQIVAVEPGRLAFVSGQVGADKDGTVPDSLAQQAENVAVRLMAALDALGATVADIAILRIYAVDLDDAFMAEAMPPLMSALDGHAPALTGIGVQSLAGAGLRIEVEMTVRLPD